MKPEEIKKLAELLWEDKETANAIANAILELQEKEKQYIYPLYFRSNTGTIAKFISLNECIYIYSEFFKFGKHEIVREEPHTNTSVWTPIAFNKERQLWDKAPVWCWDNGYVIRIATFYDEKNDMAFTYKGERGEIYWDNYELIEQVPEWMIEAEKLLEA